MIVVIGLVADAALTLLATRRRLNECARAVGQGKVAVLERACHASSHAATQHSRYQLGTLQVHY